MQGWRLSRPGAWLAGHRSAALVGGGGKTSFLARLSESVSPQLLTTTTKLQRPCPIPGTLIHQSAHPPENGFFESGKPVLWVAGADRTGNKWLAPPLAAMEHFIDSHPNLTVAVEADGSRGRPIKTPGSGEPVIPRNVSLVVACIGLSGFGCKADEETVHRLAPFQAITGTGIDGRIGIDEIVALLSHSEGLFKNCPESAERYVLFNQIDCITGDGVSAGTDIESLVENLTKAIREAQAGVTSIAFSSLRHSGDLHSIIQI